MEAQTLSASVVSFLHDESAHPDFVRMNQPPVSSEKWMWPLIS